MSAKNTFRKSSTIASPRQLAYDWHMNPFAFQRLTPPFEPVEMVQYEWPMKEGSRAILKIKQGPVDIIWKAVHHSIKAGQTFSDRQESGPFQFWDHHHNFKEISENSCELEDFIEYQLPVAPLGNIFGKSMVETKLRKVFKYRHAVTRRDLELKVRRQGSENCKILLAGASGLIGKELAAFLSLQGQTVVQLARKESQSSQFLDQIQWDPENGEIDSKALEEFDVIINLCGENIAGAKWSPQVKQQIRDSRIKTTSLLVDTINSLKSPPKLFINASAVGIYGGEPGGEVSEESNLGRGFLAEVCKDWEAATEELEQKKCRTVLLRLGVVLTPKGGMLNKLITPFMAGVGGIIGNGRQYISWITVDDVLEAIQFVIDHEKIAGPVNLTSPKPISNLDFTKALGKLIKRPTLMPMPALAAQAAFGEMAQETMLASTRAIPEKLMLQGFEFRYPTLNQALAHVLGY